MKKKLSRNNLKYIILVFIFLIGIGTFLVQKSFAIMQETLPIDGGGGGGGYIPPDPPPPPPPTVNVYVSASPASVYSRSSGPTITWSSSGGATSCDLTRSDTGATVKGLAPSDSYYAGSLTFTTTFTVNCSTAAYCSGTYTDFTTKVNYEGVSRAEGGNNTSEWDTRYWYFNVGDGGCMHCADEGEIGYKVDPTLLDWYEQTCVQNRFLGICTGVRMSDNRTYIRSGYATISCGDLSQSFCSTMTGCTWHP